MSNQHRLGQHYSNEEELSIPYEKILKEKKDKIIIDPFVGEGHLLDYYLSLLTVEEAKTKLLNNKIMGFDIHQENIDFVINKYSKKYNIDIQILKNSFKQRDSLLDNTIPEETFIFTNPPYLAKNVCKKNYKEDFTKYFERKYKQCNDYFEIAINLYSQVSGI